MDMCIDGARLSAEISRSRAGFKASSFASTVPPTLKDGGYLSPLRIVGTALPIAYVWSLPLLARLGFAHMCNGWPQCGPTGASLSDFIANAHATGAMAASFFYPALHMWLNAHQVRYHSCVFSTLAAFQGCFGLFLVCPINEVPHLHLLSVYLFCVSALIHFGVMLKHCAADRLWYCQVFLGGSIVAVGVILIIQVIPLFKPRLLLDQCPLAFFLAECIGLSSMALFPAVWYREYQKLDLRRTMTAERYTLPFCAYSDPPSPDFRAQHYADELPYWNDTLDSPKRSVSTSIPGIDVSFNGSDAFEAGLEGGSANTTFAAAVNGPHLLPQPQRFDGICCLPKAYSPLAPPAIQRPRSIG